MRTPEINLELAKELADNTVRIQALRQALERTMFGTETSVVLQDALNPLYEERQRLIDRSFGDGNGN